MRNSQKYIYPLIIVALSCLIYGHTIQHGLSFDDEYIIYSLPNIEDGFKGCLGVFKNRFDAQDYRPITIFTFAIEQLIIGDFNTSVSHFNNILLFVLGTLVLFFTLIKLPITRPLELAFIATIIFVAHPIHANVVASLKSRDVLLSFLFSTLALYFFIPFIQQKIRPSKYLIGTSFCLLLALFCKLDSIGMVFVLPFTYLLFTKAETKKVVWKSAGLFIFFGGFLYFICRGLLINLLIPMGGELTTGSEVLFTENPIVNSNNILERFSFALTAVYHYARFLIIPNGYHFYFGFDVIPIKPLFHYKNILASLGLVGLIGACFVFWRKAKVIVFASFYLMATIFFAIGIVTPVAGIVAPRLAFYSSAGFCILLASVWLIYLEPRLKKSKIGRLKLGNFSMWSILFVLFILLFYAPKAKQRASQWKDIYTLLGHDMDFLSNSFQANRIALAQYHKIAQQPNHHLQREYSLKSLKYAEQAHKIYSQHRYVEEALGAYYLQHNMFYKAKEQLENVVANFDSVQLSIQLLADINAKQNNYVEAADLYKTILVNNTVQPEIWYKYTSAMVKANRSNEARTYYTGLINGKSNIPAYLLHENMALTYYLEGDTMASSLHFMQAIDHGLNPNEITKILKEYYFRNGYIKEWEAMQNK